MKKKHQPSTQQPKTSASRKSAQDLTDEQLKEVVGGRKHNPFISGGEQPPDPCLYPPDPV